MSTETWTLEFPKAWDIDLIDGMSFVEVILNGTLDVDGSRVFAAGGVSHDGTNLVGLAYPGGSRCLRARPHTGWAVEEGYTGDPPLPEHRAVVDGIWKTLHESWAHSSREMRAEGR